MSYEARYQELREAGAHGWAGALFERNTERLRERLTRLAPFLPAPPAQVLELGCGNGVASLFLAQLGYRVHGIDIAPTAVAWARERFAEAGLAGTFSTGSVCAMPDLAAGSVDLVVDGSCLHCLIGDDRQSCLGEVGRILRPNGIFLVSSMCGEPRSEEARARFDPISGHLMDGGRPSRTLKPLVELEGELTLAGFEIHTRIVDENPWWDHAMIVCGRRMRSL